MPPYKYKTFTDIPAEEWKNIHSADDLRALVEPGGMPMTYANKREYYWKTYAPIGAGVIAGAIASALWSARRK